MKKSIMIILISLPFFLTAQNTFNTSWYLGPGNGWGLLNVQNHPGGGYTGVVEDNVHNWRLTMVRFSKDGDTLWTKPFKPKTNFTIWGVDLAISSTKDSYYFLAGNTNTKAYGMPTYNSVIKTNLDGDSLWSIDVTAPGEWSKAYMNNVIATNDGGCLVSSNSYITGMLVKISSEGKKVWSCQSASGRSNWAKVRESESGVFFAAGYYDIWRSSGENGYKMGIMKVSADGNIIWENYFNSGVVDSGDSIRSKATDVLPLSDGGCLVVGYENGPKNKSALLMRLTSEGVLSWTKRYNTHPTIQAITEVILSDGNNIIMGTVVNQSTTAAQLNVVKADIDGNIIWSQSGYNYWMKLRDKSVEGDLLFTGGHDRYGFLIRSTTDGIYSFNELNDPANNAVAVNTETKLQWSNIIQLPPTFDVEISSNSDFSDATYLSISKEEAFVKDNYYAINTTNLLPGTIYYWRVRNVGYENGYGPWSDVFSFTTEENTSVEKTSVNQLNAYISQNSVSGIITLHYFNELKGKTSIQLFDIKGNLIWKHTEISDKAGQKELTLTNELFNPGVYFCRLNNGKLETVIKTIIIK